MDPRTSTETAILYSGVVEEYAGFFDQPEMRLRFLNNTLKRQATLTEELDRRLSRAAFLKRTPIYNTLLNAWFYSLVYKELKEFLPSIEKDRLELLREKQVPVYARLIFSCFAFRRTFYALAAALLVGVLVGLYSFWVFASGQVNEYMARRYHTVERVVVRTAAASPPVERERLSYLPDYRPEKVWMVEQAGSTERYSNGARILTDYQTASHERAYYVLSIDGSQADSGIHHDPVGIVYHTSESDLLPFSAANNSSIELHTRGLLGYVKGNASYNYVIDRFGQIYRVVRDEDAANHAGNSIWADREHAYVGLNESFLGVCFETRSDSQPSSEQLTEAQIISGRLLTQVLRSRYNLDDADCVTHGLVSVNPSNMRICYHHDWVRNFPFEAFGLSDKYAKPPAGMSLFGFTYDESTVNEIGGEIWPGARAAVGEFERRAGEAKQSVEEMRRQMAARYREVMAAEAQLRSLPAGGDNATEPRAIEGSL